MKLLHEDEMNIILRLLKQVVYSHIRYTVTEYNNRLSNQFMYNV